MASEKASSEKSSSDASDEDANLVTFSGPGDPSNPKNWALWKKWRVVSTVSLFSLILPIASTMIAPSLPIMNTELNVQGGQAASVLMLSIFLLGYALGPLLISPLSEMYGRVIVLQIGNMFFLIFNLASGFAQTQAQMTVFRLLAGVGGSSTLGIGAGVIGDSFNDEQRGLAVSIYNLMPLLGPAIGPIIGGFITEYSTWRWSFWSTTIADAVVQLIGLFVLEETWAKTILQRKKKHLIKQTGNERLYTKADVEDRGRTLWTRLAEATIRPIKLLSSQVIMQALCLYLAFLYGVTFLILASLSSLWTDRYGFSLGIGNLNYIDLAVGSELGTHISSKLNDKIYKHLKTKHDEHTIPEFRLPMTVTGAILIPVRLLIYAWCAQYRVHWIAVDIGVAFYAAGDFTVLLSLQTYIIDTYTTYAASAFAAAMVLRFFFAGTFPLFAPALYQSLDYGWGKTTLALIAIFIGWPAPILLWKFGPWLRAKNPYAAENR